MVGGIRMSAATLNLVRAFTAAASPTCVACRTGTGLHATHRPARYEQLAGDIDRAAALHGRLWRRLEGVKPPNSTRPTRRCCSTTNAPCTRIDARTGKPYVTSGHFVWIGERTRELDGAHMDYLSRVENPIGVKLGPTTTPETVLEIIKKLDPEREPGRLTFIVRMGASNVREKLPPLVAAVRDSGAKVVWVTDPMHGNTITADNGYKTRRFDDILDEVRGFFEVHRSLGTYPGGLHVEMTGDDVAECLGGSDVVDESAFDQRYESLVDPRLNHKQSLELAFLVAESLTQVK